MKTKTFAIIARFGIALLLLFSVLNYLFNFAPSPNLTDNAAAFIGGLAVGGYIFPLVKMVEFVAAVALLSGRFIALALVILFPITLNILLFHAFLEPSNIAMSGLLVAGNLFLAWNHREKYRALVVAK